MCKPRALHREPRTGPVAVTGRSPEAIARYYDERLAAHGDTPEGAGWPNEADRIKRFDIMAGLFGAEMGRVSVCDVACGTGEFLSHLIATGRCPADYLGIDISPTAIAAARAKHPEARFLVCDLLAESAAPLPATFDYIVLNGLFTVRTEVGEAEMWRFMMEMLSCVWPHARRGIAFNLMSTVVDWRRDDLFHVPMDRLAAALFALAGRRVILRNDYDLYEYTAYVFRDPVEMR